MLMGVFCVLKSGFYVFLLECIFMLLWNILEVGCCGWWYSILGYGVVVFIFISLGSIVLLLFLMDKIEGCG